MNHSIAHVSRPWMFSLFTVSFALGGIAPVFAATPVSFQPQDWEAIQLLLKPEKLGVSFNGTRGYFVPNSQIRFFGIESFDFDVDLGVIGDIADARFNQLRVKSIRPSFEEGRIRVDAAFFDQKKAIRSIIGAINIREASIVAWLKPVESSNGEVTFAYDGCMIQGELTGTGLVGPHIISQVKSAVVRMVKKRLNEFFGKPNIRDSIEKGIVNYAQFSQSGELQRYVPGSLRVSGNGISYQAE